VKTKVTVAAVVVALCGAGIARAQVDFNKEFAPDKNTLLLLHFNEGTVDPKDSSPLANTVSMGNAVWVKEGKLGGAVSLKTPGPVLIESAEKIVAPEAMSAELWIKPTAEDVGPGYHVLLHKGTSSSSGNQRLYFTLLNGAVQNYPSFASGTVLKADTWYHIAYVVTGTQEKGGKEFLFINGVLDVSAPSTWTGLTQEGPFKVGTCGGETEPFTGMVDEVRISNIARPYPGVTPAK
jgi:hypothetical protein